MRDLAGRCLSLPAVLTVLTLTAAACGGSSSDGSVTPSTTVTSTTVTFTGSLAQNGSVVHSFGVTNSGYTLMAGFTSLSPSTVTALGIGIASWDATTNTCGLNLSQSDSAKSGSTAISGTASSGNYCIRIYDGGNIPAGVTATYTVQVEHY